MFKGVIVPSLTFFDAKLELDLKAQKKHIEFLVGNGADGVFIMGSAGEGVCLCDEDKVSLTGNCAEFIGGRVPMLAGISQESLPRVKKLIDRLKRFPIDAFVVTLPYYFPVISGEAIKDFFKAVADYSPKPVVIYNIPCFTNVNIRPEISAELSTYGNIVAMKDSHNELGHMLKLIRLIKQANPGFAVFAGEESILASLYGEPLDGIVPIYGNLFPQELQRLFRGMLDRKPADVLEMQGKLNEGKELISGADTFYAALKAYMHLRGVCQPFVLPPMRTATTGQMAKITEFYNRVEAGNARSLRAGLSEWGQTAYSCGIRVNM